MGNKRRLPSTAVAAAAAAAVALARCSSSLGLVVHSPVGARHFTNQAAPPPPQRLSGRGSGVQRRGTRRQQQQRVVVDRGGGTATAVKRGRQFRFAREERVKLARSSGRTRHEKAVLLAVEKSRADGRAAGGGGRARRGHELGGADPLTLQQEFELGSMVQRMQVLLKVREEVEDSLDREPTMLEWAAAADISPREVAQCIRRGRRAAEALVLHNMRFVIKLAWDMKKNGWEMSVSDMIQEGTMGLIRAVEKYDPDRGFRLTTYASAWIRQFISKATMKSGRSVRLPMHIEHGLRKVNKLKREVEAATGEEPSMAQVAEHLSIPNERLRRYLVADVTSVAVSMDAVWSPQSALGGETGGEEEWATPDSCLERDMERSLVTDRLRHAIVSLSERERWVIEARFGIAGGRITNLRETGRKLNLSHTRVPAIVNGALESLRAVVDTDEQISREALTSHLLGGGPDGEGSEGTIERENRRRAPAKLTLAF